MRLKQILNFFKKQPKDMEVVFVYYKSPKLTDKEADLLILDARRKENPELTIYGFKE